LPFKCNLQRYTAEMIQLDSEAIGKVRAVPKEVQAERRTLSAEAALAAKRGERDVNAVGLCTLNSFDPYPIAYSLSNP
jgi:hypothetical protein